MSVSPSPERIEICTPPDSPEIVFHEFDFSVRGNTSALSSEMGTPSRALRVVAPRRNFKRKRLSSTDVAISTPSNGHGPSDSSDVFGDYSELPPQGTGPTPFEANSEARPEAQPHETLAVQSTDPFEHYVDAALADCSGFFQISGKLFVVQGWDVIGQQSTMSWYHLQHTRIGNELCVACTCPHSHSRACLHERFLREYQDEIFPEDDMVSTADDSVVLFSRRANDNEEFENLFSVSTPGHKQLNSRSIISHHGVDAGNGVWKCSKDRSHDCVHVRKARDHLQKLTGSPSAKHSDREDVTGKTDFFPAPVVRRCGRNDPISHLAILPPAWAALPSDPMLYTRPPPLTNAPIMISLNANSICRCGTMYDPSRPSIKQPCTIYALSQSYNSQIEVQVCPSCQAPRKRIGPETRDLGLFNFNNHILVTHDLLDEYTSGYTSSETPFVAWVSVVARRYIIYMSSKPFLSEEMFRAVWFSYAQLQVLEGDMKCPTCGPSPETVIWDGVTLAFNRKHLLTSLRPPTTLEINSPERSACRYQTKQQLLLDGKLRKLVRKVTQGPSLSSTIIDEHMGPEEDEIQVPGREPTDGGVKGGKGDIQAEAAAAIAHIEGITSVLEQLRAVNPALGSLFEEHFGIKAYASGRKVSSVWRELFLEISAEESVLQMANRTALQDLQTFNQNPTTHNASRLVTIPALYNALKHEEKEHSCYRSSMIQLCEWVHKRGMEVLEKLLVHGTPPNFNIPRNDINWKTTGCCYSMPQIRHRPKYPALTHDQRKESGGSRGAKCSKYYSQYGEQRLTGGIMCAWCTHSVCYGFHCIPHGEGRNDVFSAMITRWPKAPKRVIYDFACALGPYCMTREAEFFADTLFVIDAFHAKGHSKCSPAAFLTSYSNINPRLAHLNSSAAECGNGGLSRIRKSVSYMSQQRAIQYTKTFLCIWNRLRIRKLLGNIN